MQQGAATPIRRGSPVVGVASPITGYRRVPKSPPKSPLSSLITSPSRSAQTPRSPDRKSGAEQQLAVFFFQCDEYRTGQVLKEVCCTYCINSLQSSCLIITKWQKMILLLKTLLIRSVLVNSESKISKSSHFWNCDENAFLYVAISQNPPLRALKKNFASISDHLNSFQKLTNTPQYRNKIQYLGNHFFILLWK